jgi:hypothetical protein
VYGLKNGDIMTTKHIKKYTGIITAASLMVFITPAYSVGMGAARRAAAELTVPAVRLGKRIFATRAAVGAAKGVLHDVSISQSIRVGTARPKATLHETSRLPVYLSPLRKALCLNPESLPKGNLTPTESLTCPATCMGFPTCPKNIRKLAVARSAHLSGLQSEAMELDCIYVNKVAEEVRATYFSHWDADASTWTTEQRKIFSQLERAELVKRNRLWGDSISSLCVMDNSYKNLVAFDVRRLELLRNSVLAQANSALVPHVNHHALIAYPQDPSRALMVYPRHTKYALVPSKKGESALVPYIPEGDTISHGLHGSGVGERSNGSTAGKHTTGKTDEKTSTNAGVGAKHAAQVTGAHMPDSEHSEVASLRRRGIHPLAAIAAGAGTALFLRALRDEDKREEIVIQDPVRSYKDIAKPKKDKKKAPHLPDTKIKKIITCSAFAQAVDRVFSYATSKPSDQTQEHYEAASEAMRFIRMTVPQFVMHGLVPVLVDSRMAGNLFPQQEDEGIITRFGKFVGDLFVRIKGNIPMSTYYEKDGSISLIVGPDIQEGMCKVCWFNPQAIATLEGQTARASLCSLYIFSLLDSPFMNVLKEQLGLMFSDVPADQPLFILDALLHPHVPQDVSEEDDASVLARIFVYHSPEPQDPGVADDDQQPSSTPGEKDKETRRSGADDHNPSGDASSSSQAQLEPRDYEEFFANLDALLRKARQMKVALDRATNKRAKRLDLVGRNFRLVADDAYVKIQSAQETLSQHEFFAEPVKKSLLSMRAGELATTIAAFDTACFEEDADLPKALSDLNKAIVRLKAFITGQ